MDENMKTISAILDAAEVAKDQGLRLKNTDLSRPQRCTRGARCAHFKSAVQTPCDDCGQPISTDHIHDPSKGYRLDHACLSKRYDSVNKTINYPATDQGETLLCAHGAVCSDYSQFRVKRCDLCNSPEIDIHYHDIVRNIKLCQACLGPQVLDYYLGDSGLREPNRNTNKLVARVRDAVIKHSSELTTAEVHWIWEQGGLEALMQKLWRFTGNFYRWPQALLGRDDLGPELENNLRENLETELGLKGGLAHTELFANMANSIGVELTVPAPMGSLISHVINQAQHASLPTALGQFFANECLPKWGGFVEALADTPGADLEFFEIHMDEVCHYQELANELTPDQEHEFMTAAFAYARTRAGFMQTLREMLLVEELMTG